MDILYDICTCLRPAKRKKDSGDKFDMSNFLKALDGSSLHIRASPVLSKLHSPDQSLRPHHLDLIEMELETPKFVLSMSPNTETLKDHLSRSTIKEFPLEENTSKNCYLPEEMNIDQSPINNYQKEKKTPEEGSEEKVIRCFSFGNKIAYPIKKNRGRSQTANQNSSGKKDELCLKESNGKNGNFFEQLLNKSFDFNQKIQDDLNFSEFEDLNEKDSHSKEWLSTKDFERLANILDQNDKRIQKQEEKEKAPKKKDSFSFKDLDELDQFKEN